MSNQNKKKHNQTIKAQNQRSVEVIKNGETSVAIKGTASATYEGPLPPPEILRGFAEIYPDSVELIFKEFERNSKHEREMENRKLKEDSKIAKRGQWMAFCLGILLLVFAAGAVYIGSPWLAGGALFVAIAGTAKSVTISRNSKNK